MPKEEIEKNYKVFKDELENILEEHSGDFVVLHEEEIKEIFDSFEDAWKWASDKYEPETFIIQKVERDVSNFVMKQAV